jgi:hypothetical protein
MAVEEEEGGGGRGPTGHGEIEEEVAALDSGPEADRD